MFIAAGHSPEYVDFLHVKITDELVNLETHMYFRVSIFPELDIKQ